MGVRTGTPAGLVTVLQVARLDAVMVAFTDYNVTWEARLVMPL